MANQTRLQISKSISTTSEQSLVGEENISFEDTVKLSMTSHGLQVLAEACSTTCDNTYNTEDEQDKEMERLRLRKRKERMKAKVIHKQSIG